MHKQHSSTQQAIDHNSWPATHVAYALCAHGEDDGEAQQQRGRILSAKQLHKHSQLGLQGLVLFQFKCGRQQRVNTSQFNLPCADPVANKQRLQSA
jgi:hypothetical protein